MRLSIDVLLAELRENAEAILAAIDTDPMLVRRVSGDLVLANASQALYTPTAEHHLYAKGIVYRREPYRLVSLPLIKIYNAGEREVTVADLGAIAGEPGVRLRFLRKMDGSLIQVFRDGGRVYFTTRGMIEGARWRYEEADEDRQAGFDYLAEARSLMQRLHPNVLTDESLLEGRTLLFELIHYQARKVTDYGNRADLTLLACFDQRRYCYLGYDDLGEVARAGGLCLVDALSPSGEDLSAQMDSLLASLAGTDEEGSVLCFERNGEVVYRVKIKSPEYLQLMRLMAFCTYERTVEVVDSVGARSWPELEVALQEQGRSRVPEEILGFYRQHWERFGSYLADLGRLRSWAEERRHALTATVGGVEVREFRKGFAALAVQEPHPALVFAALDGRLDDGRLRKLVRSPEEARELVERLGLSDTPTRANPLV